MSRPLGDAARAGATDRIFALYMAASALALLFAYRPALWPLLLAVHATAIALVLRAGPVRRAADAAAGTRLGALLLEWYPLLLVPALYTEIAILNQAVHGGRYFDLVVIGWEDTVFGGQPSRALAARLPWLPLSEALHAAYLSYYLIIYLPMVVLWWRGRRDEFRLAMFAVMLAFLAHYLVFIYFPVQGPRYLFPAPTGGSIETGTFYQLAHRVLEAGSSRGAAFPSSHVAIAVVQTMSVMRLHRWAGRGLGVLTAGLALGAVYGGFHYGVDAAAGLAAGLLVARIAPSLYRRLQPAEQVPAVSVEGPA